MSHFSPRTITLARPDRVEPKAWLGLLTFTVATLLAFPALAATLKVPQQHPTIQGAVDAASPGDEIEVSKGRYCGATINKPLTLTSVKKGGATIIGCATSPILVGPLRIGFFLPGTAGTGTASGTRIRGFAFDGKGISNSNLSPLAFGVYSRFNHHVVIKDNKITGTVQAITNTAGDNWSISDNQIEQLTLFDCTGAFCGGGVGIAIQFASAAIGAPGGASDPLNRPEANAVVDNEIEGKAPTGFDVFGMDGILLFVADGTAVVKNDTKIKPGLSGSAPLGVGILVTNTCCDDPAQFLPGSRYAALVLNEDHSQFGIVVEGTGGANTLGLVLFGNQGTTQIEGAPALMAAEASLGAPGLAAGTTGATTNKVAKPIRRRFE